MLEDHNMNLSIENNLGEFHGCHVNFQGNSSAREQQFLQVLHITLVNFNELHGIELNAVRLVSGSNIL